MLNTVVSHFRMFISVLKYIAKVRTQQQQKQAWYIQEVKNEERSRKIAQTHKEERNKVQKRGESHRDTF